MAAPTPARRRAAPGPRAALAAALVAALLLAGCSDAADPSDPTAALPGGGASASGTAAPPAPATPTSPTALDRMDVEGVVQTTDFIPIEGARVAVRGTGRNATTDADGRFAFLGLEPTAHLIDVSAPGYEPAVLRVEPAPRATLDVQLQPVAPPEARVETLSFRGHFQCALEAAIISGPCDAVLTSDTTLGMDPVFQSNGTFDAAALPGWATVVVDVVFEPDHPGMAGLRVAAKGLHDGSDLGDYQQYGRFFGDGPFTFRLDPGASYEEGEVPVPVNATQFRFEAYPHSHGWHATCAALCLLGAGAGVDVAFELYVSVFYNEPAPQGWTLLDD